MRARSHEFPRFSRISLSFPASRPLQSFLNRFLHASVVRHAAPFLMIRTHVPVFPRFSPASPVYKEQSRFWCGYWSCDYYYSTVTSSTRARPHELSASPASRRHLSFSSRFSPASIVAQPFLTRICRPTCPPFLFIRTHVPVLARFSHASHQHFPFTNNILDFGAGNT